uniref:Uncharacterized protein n=1 Tax=Meloidogyne enterolobii TaxID=390850 RepID=A0A6V7V8W1_MELEN|nr:unnamed protein product [Meloidogyne enterolobii]
MCIYVFTNYLLIRKVSSDYEDETEERTLKETNSSSKSPFYDFSNGINDKKQKLNSRYIKRLFLITLIKEISRDSIKSSF